MRRQAAELAAVRPRATHDAGVWRLPKGDEYYAYALRFATTTGMSAEEVHQLGLDRMAALTARADAIFKAPGMTKGSVAERMRALGKEPRFLSPTTDKGDRKSGVAGKSVSVSATLGGLRNIKH